MTMKDLYSSVDTPALLVDRAIVLRNIDNMQKRADRAGVALRPHTKTHRTPAIAAMQVKAGAQGITVAKLGEAEVMAENGMDDIFIANEIYGDLKFARLRSLAATARLSVGVDNREQVTAISRFFEGAREPANVLIEVETGEVRSGMLPGPELVELAKFIAATPNVRLKGIFSHEGHTYGAEDREQCAAFFRKAQEETLGAAEMIRAAGVPVETVSIGATPSLLVGGDILPGVTEIRPGTYVFMDAAQGAAVGSYDTCAATVLATVMSKPTAERVVLDAGVKALTAVTRDTGICRAPGYGLIKGLGGIRLGNLYDEHGLVYGREANERLSLGDRVEIIPNHICPTCNLYDRMYLVEDGRVVDELPILCRGKSQ
jgi:D-serine deaminase-like pyridoxal phosphate-dependent protein